MKYHINSRLKVPAAFPFVVAVLLGTSGFSEAWAENLKDKFCNKQTTVPTNIPYDPKGTFILICGQNHITGNQKRAMTNPPPEISYGDLVKNNLNGVAVYDCEKISEMLNDMAGHESASKFGVVTTVLAIQKEGCK
jgi:hypothetical protein